MTPGEAIIDYFDETGTNRNIGDIFEEMYAPEKSKRDILADWWRESAESEINMVVDKAIEYGATDLYEIGRKVLSLHGPRAFEIASERQVILVGIYFYLEGKMARFASAIQEGREVSADTVLDIGVYARMAQRVLQVGAWPGV